MQVEDKCAYCDEDIGDYAHYEITQGPAFPIGRFKDGRLKLICTGQKWHAHCLPYQKSEDL